MPNGFTPTPVSEMREELREQAKSQRVIRMGTTLGYVNTDSKPFKAFGDMVVNHGWSVTGFYHNTIHDEYAIFVSPITEVNVQ